MKKKQNIQNQEKKRKDDEGRTWNQNGTIFRQNLG